MSATDSEYVILQKTTAKPPVAKLERAFKVLAELVDIDAPTLANDAYGIIADKLSRERADKLNKALLSEGIETEVVEQDKFLKLPKPKQLKRLDCLPEKLVVYDAIGRPQDIQWPQVKLLAAGIVSTVDFNRIEKERVVYKRGPRGGAYPIFLTDVSHDEEMKSKFLLEIYLDVAPGRYHVEADQCAYNYLKERLNSGYMNNFCLMMQDITKYARQAILSRGAESMKQEGNQILKYPSKHAFEEEIIWLLWMNGIRA
ncbi:hypothetical protein ACFLS1_12700 [Verrucomicrobiota bacterium]